MKMKTPISRENSQDLLCVKARMFGSGNFPKAGAPFPFHHYPDKHPPGVIWGELGFKRGRPLSWGYG
jgi:hypothetical protein